MSEGGGRLDRLDLWFLVILVLASMSLRMFRLAEPYQMHFDEVYHARTATEFLQDWRYGESHDIYEWTHPHLAKYAMAAGLVLWGEDDVAATSELGVPVKAAVVEPRRDDPTAPGGRAGERLHVATGTEIRTYDLRTRALISTIPAPGVSALALDPAGTEMVVGFDDGRVATLDLGSIDADAAAAGVAPLDLGKVGGAVTQLFVPDDGSTIIVGQHDRLDVIDDSTGDPLGGLDAPGSRTSATAGAATPSRRPSRTSRTHPPPRPSSRACSMARRRPMKPSCAGPARRPCSAARGAATPARPWTRRSPTGSCPASR